MVQELNIDQRERLLELDGDGAISGGRFRAPGWMIMSSDGGGRAVHVRPFRLGIACSRTRR